MGLVPVVAYCLQYLFQGIVIELYCAKEMNLSAWKYSVGEALCGCIYSFLLFSDYTIFFSPPSNYLLDGSEQQDIWCGLWNRFKKSEVLLI